MLINPPMKPLSWCEHITIGVPMDHLYPIGRPTPQDDSNRCFPRQQYKQPCWNRWRSAHVRAPLVISKIARTFPNGSSRTAHLPITISNGSARTVQLFV